MAGYSSHHLEAFVDVVRRKSFSSVARNRGLTPSSIARQINALEEELGVTLFIRSTRTLVPTEAGRLLYERSEQILDDLEQAKNAAKSLRDDVRGCVRLSCWPTFAKRCVLPHLPQLLKQYPELRVDLDLSERLHAPALGRTDLVVRMGELTSSSLRASPLGVQRSAIAASPTYVNQHGMPATLADFSSHRLIDKRHTARFMGWRTLLGDSRATLEQTVLQTDDLEAQVEACKAGLGLIFLPTWAFQENARRGELLLIPVDGLEQHSSAEIHLLRNPGKLTASIDAFSRFLRMCVAPHLA
ncbi:LysR family transcriptional regulator [Terriglobus tenax]|uniref:LysR family transcriptional regulator n=1 Tax=Terriglobus tenax TaxID=1111115 RepID=UPI0021E001F0|nr:LysR family transcriptional regulator [Terriglobus tenax]